MSAHMRTTVLNNKEEVVVAASKTRAAVNAEIEAYHLRLGFCPYPFYTLTPLARLEPNLWDENGIRLSVTASALTDWDSLCEELRASRELCRRKIDPQAPPVAKPKSAVGGFAALTRHANACEQSEKAKETESDNQKGDL